MAGSRTLKLSILADVSNLSKGLDSSSKDVGTFGDKITKFGKVAGAAFLAAGVAAAAFAVKFAKDAIVAGEAAATANARIEQINQSMGLFGSSVGVVNDRLIKYAEKTARATGIDTNSIKATQAKLLTFKELAKTADNVGGQFDRATKAAIDLASAGFGSAESNAVQLGKALNDPIKGLTSLAKSGVTFTTQEKERIKTLVESNKVGEAQALILSAIETQVGGTAEATANATDRMKVGFQQVTERVGIALLPILEKFTKFLLEVVFPTFEKYVLPVVEKLSKAFSDKSGGLGHTVSMAAETLKSIFMPIWNGLRSAFDSVRGAIGKNLDTFKAFGQFIALYLAPVIGKVLGGALTVAGKVAGGVINVIGGVLRVLGTLIKGAIGGINLLISAYNAIPFLPDIPKIKLPTFSVPEIPTPVGTGDMSELTSVPTLTQSELEAGAITVGGGTSSTSSTGGTGGGGVSTAAKSAQTSAARITGLGASGVSGVNTTTLAGILAASGTTIINVNGAIDKEGTARTIVDTLNNSFYRGTGGANNLVSV